MYSSVFEAIEATKLYQQTPGILLGLLLLTSGGTLLAIGLGAVHGVRSRLCTSLGGVALVAALLVRGVAPETAFLLIIGTVSWLLIVVLAVIGGAYSLGT